MALIHSKQLNPKFTGSFTLSGSNQTFVGSSEFQGSVTASGNISSSANITGNILNVNTRVKAIGSSLEFAGDTLDFVDSNSTSRFFKGVSGGAFEAYHSGNKKLETEAGGVNVTGHISASGDVSASGDIHAIGTGRIIEQGTSVVDTATALAIVFGG